MLLYCIFTAITVY